MTAERPQAPDFLVNSVELGKSELELSKMTRDLFKRLAGDFKPDKGESAVAEVLVPLGEDKGNSWVSFKATFPVSEHSTVWLTIWEAKYQIGPSSFHKVRKDTFIPEDYVTPLSDQKTVDGVTETIKYISTFTNEELSLNLYSRR